MPHAEERRPPRQLRPVATHRALDAPQAVVPRDLAEHAAHGAGHRDAVRRHPRAAEEPCVADAFPYRYDAAGPNHAAGIVEAGERHVLDDERLDPRAELGRWPVMLVVQRGVEDLDDVVLAERYQPHYWSNVLKVA